MRPDHKNMPQIAITQLGDWSKLVFAASRILSRDEPMTAIALADAFGGRHGVANFPSTSITANPLLFGLALTAHSGWVLLLISFSSQKTSARTASTSQTPPTACRCAA
jgi:hypothetical protein